VGGRRGWRRMVEMENTSTKHLIHCKNFSKCHNVPPPSTTIKNKYNQRPGMGVHAWLHSQCSWGRDRRFESLRTHWTTWRGLVSTKQNKYIFKS
jgi:hypothetical protein